MKRITGREILLALCIVLGVVVLFSIAKSPGTSAASSPQAAQGADADQPGDEQAPDFFAVTPAQSASLAPDFTLPTLDGKSVTLSEAAKKGPVVIDFWATWCGPCKQEMPELEAVYSKYKSQGVQIYGIDSNDSVGTMRDFLANGPVKVSYPMLVDDGALVHQSYNVTGIPAIYVIDKQCRVRSFVGGYETNSRQDLFNCLDKILKEQ